MIDFSLVTCGFYMLAGLAAAACVIGYALKPSARHGAVAFAYVAGSVLAVVGIWLVTWWAHD
jgi:hypothetical protein